MAQFPNKSTQFYGEGKGIKHGQAPICVKFSADVDAILRELPDRSDRIRKWVLEGMAREGLIE